MQICELLLVPEYQKSTLSYIPCISPFDHPPPRHLWSEIVPTYINTDCLDRDRRGSLRICRVSEEGEREQGESTRINTISQLSVSIRSRKPQEEGTNIGSRLDVGALTHFLNLEFRRYHPDTQPKTPTGRLHDTIVCTASSLRRRDAIGT